MISSTSVIRKQARNIQKMDVNKMLTEVAKSNESALLDIHRDQLRRGESGSGKTKPDYFSPYRNYKEGLPSYFGGGSPDLYLTGSFQDSEFMKFPGSNYEFDSRDGKTSKLVDKYGETIFDLNPNSLTLAQEVVTPKFLKVYHIALNK